MVANRGGEPELLCNNRGVDFEEAYADVELRDLNLYKPNESIVVGKLLPDLKNGVMAAQATQLSCGGVVVGCTFDHRVADAYSANLFWRSWAEMARSMPLSNLPSFRRSLFSPRRPGTFNFSVTDLYTPTSELSLSLFKKKLNSSSQPPLPLSSRIYSVSLDQIRRLQHLANNKNPSSLILKRTKLEAFSAFLWKLIASGANTGENGSRLRITIDGRTRINDGAMSNYFGNVTSYSFGMKKCWELEEMPLSSIVNEIHNFLDVVVTKEHFLGLIDFVEAHRPKLVTSRTVTTIVQKDDHILTVSSMRGFLVGEMDFGWGTPIFGSYISPSGLPTSVVLLTPNASENGDWVIYMHLTKQQVEVIENTGSHVFQPFCLGYVFPMPF